MAVTFIGADSRDGGAASAASTAAFALPVGAAVGDLVIAVASVERDIIPGITWPTAGESVGRSEMLAGTQAVLIEWKRLVSGDLGGNIQATVSPNRRIACAYVCLRGAADPVFTNGAQVNSAAADFAAEHPNATPTVDDSWLVSMLAATSGVGAIRTLSWTSAGTYTERADDSSTAASVNAGVYIATRALIGGSGVSQTGNVATESDRLSYFPTTVVVAPTSSDPQTITMQVIASTVTVGQPIVSVEVLTIQPQLISSTSSVGQPLLAVTDISKTLQRVESVSTVGQPVIGSGSISRTLQVIASTALVRQPILTPVITVLLQMITPASYPGDTEWPEDDDYPHGVEDLIYPPIVTQLNDVTIQLQVISSTSNVLGPVISVTSLTVVSQTIVSVAQVFLPVVSITSISVQTQTIASSSQVFRPIITVTSLTRQMQIIASTSTVSRPIVSISSISVVLSRIASIAQVFYPDVHNESAGLPNSIYGSLITLRIRAGDVHMISQLEADINQSNHMRADVEVTGIIVADVIQE